MALPSTNRHALCLRYGWRPARLPSLRLCGKAFSLSHAFSCPRGAFPSIRHDQIRDLFAAPTCPLNLHFNQSQERPFPAEVLMLMIAQDWMSKPRISGIVGVVHFYIRFF